MKNLYSLLLLFVVTFVSAQVSGEKFIYKRLGWTIQLPKGYSALNKEEGQKIQDKGLKMIEATYDTDLEDVLVETTTIFMLKNGATNYMEANLQAFDPVKDGDFDVANRELAEMVNRTLKEQIPAAAKVEMSLMTEVIGGKNFFLAKYIINIPGNMKLNMFMYTGLFGKKSLTVNIMYVNSEDGKILMDSWKSSEFKK